MAKPPSIFKWVPPKERDKPKPVEARPDEPIDGEILPPPKKMPKDKPPKPEPGFRYDQYLGIMVGVGGHGQAGHHVGGGHSGNPATDTTHLTMYAGTGQFSLPLATAGSRRDDTVVAGKGTFGFTGKDATMLVSQSPSALVLAAQPGVFTLSGQATSGTSSNNGQFALGVNIAAMDFYSASVPPLILYPTTSDLDYWYALGCRRVRLPFKWEYIQPTLLGALDTAVLGHITDMIDGAISRGMKILLDVHSFGQYNGVPFGSGSVTKAAFVDLWTKLATALVGKSSTYVAYDLMNEPVGSSEAIWVDYAKGAIAAIGAIDVTKKIYVEGYFFASTWSWVANNPTLHTVVTASLGNEIIMSGHLYPDRDNSGTHYNWNTEAAAAGSAPTGTNTNVNILVQRSTGFFDWCVTHGFKPHIGEVGAPADPTNPRATNDINWQTTLSNFLDVCVTRGAEVDMWSAGPFWGSYPLSVAPYGGRQSRTVTTLQVYWGTRLTVNPTTYFSDGPSRGLAGASSSNFTIDYRGHLASSVTITPHSTAGGTFTPATATLPAGDNPVVTFTLNIATEQVTDVTFTNSGGLTNPIALRYTTQVDDFATVESSLQNVFDFRRIVATYIGPCIRLRRSSDSAESDFNFTSNAMYSYLDTSAVSSWAGSDTLYVVTLYNQSYYTNPFHAGAPNSDSTQGIGVLADQPTFTLDGGDGYPYVYFNNSRMDWWSPLELVTGQVIIANANYDADGGYCLVGWSYVNFSDSFGPGWSFDTDLISPFDTNVYGVYSDLLTMTQPLEALEWHVYSGSWTGGPLEDGCKTWRDGHLMGINRTGSAYLTVDYHKNEMNMGFTRFSNHRCYYKLRGLVVINGNPVSDVLVSTIEDRMISFYDTDDSALPTPDIILDFAANTYTVDGVGTTLAAQVTGGAGPAPTRDSNGLICGGTQQYALQGASKTAIQQDAITIQIDTVNVTGPGGSNYKAIGYLENTASGGTYAFEGWDSIGQIYTGFKIKGSAYNDGIGGADKVPTDDDSIWYTGEKRHATASDKTQNTIAFAENGEIVSSWQSTDLPDTLPNWQDYFIGWWGAGDAGASSLVGRIKRIRIWRQKLTRHQLFAATQNLGTKGSVPAPFKMGVNLAGKEFGSRRWTDSTNFSPTTEESVYYGGIFPGGIVRIPYTWERMQHTLMGPLDTTELGILKRIVADNTANGLTTLLDMHNYATYYREDLADYFGIDSTDTPGMLTTSHLADFYSKMAQVTEFNRSDVWFGLMNEPFQYGTIAQWFSSCSAWATAIRGHNVVSTIAVPTVISATSALYWSKYSGADFLTSYVDTANKSVIEVHKYFDSDGSGTHAGSVVRGLAIRSFSNLVRWCRANNKRFIIGETGWEASAVVSQSHCEAEDMFNLLRNADDVCAGFCAWSGGPAWSNYFLIYEPYRAGILLDGFGDPRGDRPQISCMKKWVPNPY